MPKINLALKEYKITSILKEIIFFPLFFSLHSVLSKKRKKKKWNVAFYLPLNFKEWPRSQAARENSLKKTISSKPPMSLIFLDRKLDKLIGHAKLCSIIGDDESCWIESVVITKKLRGRRLGARLINAVEKKASQFGFHKVFIFHLFL